MKTVLFIGPYLQNDGWGIASREYLRALRMTDHEIIARPIRLNSSKSIYESDEFDDLEKNVGRVNVVIQNCLPDMFTKFANVKNIGLGFFEASILNTTWSIHMKMLDEMWVCSEFEKGIIGDSVPTKVVKYPTSISKYNIKYIPENQIFEQDDIFRFYFIGENYYRKNISDLILAFYTEFINDIDVELVIKSNNISKSADYTSKNINDIIDHCKYITGIRNRHDNIRVITEYLSDNDMYALHQSCDCFVSASRGEGFCIPAFDALGFKKYPIINENTSSSEYVTDSINGLKIRSRKTPCIATDRPGHFLYTAKDYWYDIDICHLMELMREARTNMYPDSREYDTANTLNSHTHQSVAKYMQEIL